VPHRSPARIDPILINHIEVDDGEFTDQAVKYNLEDEIDTLSRYLETQARIDNDRFQEWNKFQELPAYSVRS